MAPPGSMPCGKPGCDWATPATCPNWDTLRWAMDNHILTAHPELRVQQQGQGGGGSSRQERLPRPTLDTGITEADWTFFESQWERYKRSTRLDGQDATDQLWACASDELSRQAHDAGASKDTSEADLIALLKLCSIRAQNKLVNIVEFLNILQEPAEPVAKFVSRVKGQAKVCDFTVKCPGDECDQVVSYSEQLVSHVIVRGLEDSEIQERVLALAATEENLDLKRISEYIYAQETGRESRKLLSAGGVNKLSQYQQDKRGRSNTTPSNMERPNVDKCYYCGNTGHGYKSSADVRKTKCPAFNKKCLKCKRIGHFSKQCRKSRDNEHGALQERGSVSDSGELDGFGFYAMTVPATRPRHKVRDLRKLSHHAADQFGNWAARRAEPQPVVTVSVSVCSEGYEQVGIPAPRKPRTITSPALPDTGAQMVVAGMDLVHRLGVTRKELFPVTSGIRAANSEGLKLIGALLLTVSAVGADGNTRTGSHMCYISENVTRLFLSKAACRDLGIIGQNFPEVGDADSQASVNKCEFMDPGKPDSCECPKRAATPDPPAELPCPATEENIPRLSLQLLRAAAAPTNERFPSNETLC